MERIKKIARQGDLLFINLNDKRSKKVKDLRSLNKAKDNILAHGEATGHMHQAIGTGLMVFDYVNSGKIIEALNAFEITHNEHDNITLEKGSWEVRRQREYTPEGIKAVVD